MAAAALLARAVKEMAAAPVTPPFTKSRRVTTGCTLSAENCSSFSLLFMDLAPSLRENEMQVRLICTAKTVAVKSESFVTARLNLKKFRCHFLRKNIAVLLGRRVRPVQDGESTDAAGWSTWLRFSDHWISRIDTSYNSTIGVPSSNCDITSGGVRNAAT